MGHLIDGIQQKLRSTKFRLFLEPSIIAKGQLTKEGI